MSHTNQGIGDEPPKSTKDIQEESKEIKIINNEQSQDNLFELPKVKDENSKTDIGGLARGGLLKGFLKIDHEQNIENAFLGPNKNFQDQQSNTQVSDQFNENSLSLIAAQSELGVQFEELKMSKNDSNTINIEQQQNVAFLNKEDRPFLVTEVKENLNSQKDITSVEIIEQQKDEIKHDFKPENINPQVFQDVKEINFMEELKNLELNEDEIIEEYYTAQEALKNKKGKLLLKKEKIFIHIGLVIKSGIVHYRREIQPFITEHELGEDLTESSVQCEIEDALQELQKEEKRKKQKKVQQLKEKLQDLKIVKEVILKIENFESTLQNKLQEDKKLEDNGVQEEQKNLNIQYKEQKQDPKQVELNKLPEKIYQLKNFDSAQKIYLKADNNEKLNILTQLHSQNLKIYLQILEIDTYLQTLSQYKDLNEQLLFLQTQTDYKSMSQQMIEQYRQNQIGIHCSVKFHVEFTKQNPLLLESPMTITAIQQELSLINVPDDCKQLHQLILKNAAECSFENIFKIFEKITQKQYKQAVSIVLSKLGQFQIIIQDRKQTAQIFEAFNKFSKSFKFFLPFNDLKFAIFEESSVTSAVKIFSKLITQSQEQPSQILEEVIKLHLLIKKIFPDFSNIITMQFILISFAPDNSKANVQDLFKKLELEDSLNKNQGKMDYKGSVKLLLEEILYEDADFTKQLLSHLTECEKYAWLDNDIAQIQDLNTKRQITIDQINKSIIYNNSTLQSIPDFLAIIVDTDIEQLQKQISEEYRHSGTIQGNKLQIVLYDLIKKRCTFDKFLTQLSPNSQTDKEMLYTQLSLQIFLLENSDTFLKTLLLMACSSFMPLPLIVYKQMIFNKPAQNEEEFKEHEMPIQFQNIIKDPQSFRPLIYEELFFTFEKFKSVLNFKLSANENKSPQGCTTMTNFIFQKGFEKHSKTTANHGSIEIQFDYNFEKPMFIPAADAHGLVSHKILEKVYQLFDIFMIHINKSDQNQLVLEKEIGIIRKRNDKSVIITIEYDDNIKESKFTTEIDKNNSRNIKIKMCSFIRLNQLQQNQLKIFILEEYMKVVRGFNTYQETIQNRIQSLETFSNFTKNFITMINIEFLPQQINLNTKQKQDAIELYMRGSNKVREALAIIKQFMHEIYKNQDQLHSEKVLTMNFFFRKAALLEKRLAHDNNMTQKLCDQTRAEINELTQRIKKEKPSSMTQQLKNIMNHENYVGISSIISKFLKSYLSSQLKPLINKKTDLHTQMQQPNIPQDTKQLMLTEIKKLSDKIDLKWYSNEFLYREFYIYERVLIKDPKKDGVIPYENYLSLVNLQLQQGQPFEIIDGNNLQFVSDVYHRIQMDESQNDNILVVSVIGPQSSGKSLLLNTLFGAQFLSSAGRCTRGIYGCLIDVKAMIGGTRYSKILLLDSEGIQQTEGRDEQFDRRIVFYILCVSHIVLICNKGEMNSPMQELIKIATDAISQLRDQISKQPQVNIIMNMVPQIDEQSLAATIQDLTMAILEMNQQKNQQQLFTINRDNVFMLPNAFASSGCDDMVVNQPSFQFAQRVEKLRRRIIDFLQNKDIEESTQYSIDSWFKFAAKFWKFTDEFDGITQYSTLDERKQDLMLSTQINQMIQTKFQDKNNSQIYEDKINELAQIVLKEHEGFNQTSVKELSQKIDQKILPFKVSVEEEFQEEFKKFCDEKGVDPILKKKRQAQLDKQVTQHICGWNQIMNKLISDFMDLKSKFIGDQSFQKAIQILIKNNSKTYNEDEANEIFSKEQNKVEQDIIKSLKKKDQVIEEILHFVSNMYKANTNIKGGNYERESRCLHSYLKTGHQYIQQTLKEQNSFFYYSGKNIRPDPQQIINSCEKQQQILQVQELFTQIRQQDYYNWEQVVRERFEFSVFQMQLQEIASKIKFKFWTLSDVRLITNQDQLTKMIAQVNKEGQHYCVQISEYLQNQIYNIERLIAQKIQDSYNLNYYEMNPYEEANFIRQNVIPMFVDNVKAQISQCFKYTQTTKLPLLPWTYFNHDTKRIPINSYAPQTFSMHLYVNKQANSMVDSVLPPLGQHGLKKAEIKLVVHQNIRDNDPILTQYLEYLASPDINNLKRDDMISNTAQQYFYKSINHEKIIKKIQHIVLENVSRTQNKIDQNETVEIVLDYLKKSTDISVIQNYCTLDYRVIQQTISGVAGIISIIDDELKPYCFQVSEKGIMFLHLLAMTYISSLMIELKWISDRGPLFTLQKNIDIQRRLFVAKLTSNDIQMDTNQAVMTAKTLAKEIHEELKQKILTNFKSVLSAEKEIFQLKTIVADIENDLLSIADGQQHNIFQKEEQKMIGNTQYRALNYQENKKQQQEQHKIQEIVQFYVQPKIFFEYKFQEIWDVLAKKEIEQQFKKFFKQRHEIMKEIQQYFQKLLDLIDQKHMTVATDAFIPKTQGESPQDIQFKQICQKAFTEYFLLLLSKEWIQGQELIIDGEEIIVNPSQVLVTPEDIGLELNLKYIKIIINDLQDTTISNLQSFIIEFMKCIEQELTQQDTLTEQELIGDSYKSLRSKTLGCDQYCPLCHRQCDQDHQEAIDDRIHKCESGHQIQGFGGNRHKGNDAITFGCNDLDDDDVVFWEGNETKWNVFKGKLEKSPHNWYLDEIHKGLNKLHKEKYVKIWNLIGDRICSYYNTVEKIEIKYVSADLKSSNKRQMTQKILYILILDQSGSMADIDTNQLSGWDNLLQAMKQFLGALEANFIQKMNSKVSIITYTSDCRLVCDQQIPSINLISGLGIPNGGTNFDPPLECAKDLMEKHMQSFDHFTVCLMSDGEANYPSKAAQSIKNSSQIMSKMDFQSVAYGKHQSHISQTLQPLADNLGGKFVQALEAKQLAKAFIELIPNLYGVNLKE